MSVNGKTEKPRRKLRMRRDAETGGKMQCQTFMSFLAGQGRNEKRVRKKMSKMRFVYEREWVCGLKKNNCEKNCVNFSV